MAKRFSAHNMPDPLDRTPNTPAILVDADDVLSIYNDVHLNSLGCKNRVDEDVSQWFMDYMRSELKWTQAKQFGTTFLLVADVTLVRK